jgi:hypothetical protein
MNACAEEAMQILKLVVRKPDTPTETVVTAVLVFVMFLTIMWLAGLAFKMPDTNLIQRILAGGLVLTVGLAAATAASILAGPKVEKEIVQKAIMTAAPILAVLVIGIPLAMLTMRARYFQTLFTVGLAIAAAWGLSLLSESIFDTIRIETNQASKGANHKNQINQMLDSIAGTPTNAQPVVRKLGRDPRNVADEARERERAAAEKAAREKALRDRF